VGLALGSDDVANSGPLPSHQTTFQVPSLPAGRQLFARIYSAVDGHWSHSDVRFTAAAANEATLTFPANGQAGVEAGRPFVWSRVAWATNYWLIIGTAEGGSDVLNTGPLPAGQTSYSVPSLPPAVPLHARLLTSDGTNWTYADVTFTATG
jgi:hypothetical protein